MSPSNSHSPDAIEKSTYFLFCRLGTFGLVLASKQNLLMACHLMLAEWSNKGIKTQTIRLTSAQSMRSYIDSHQIWIHFINSRGFSPSSWHTVAKKPFACGEARICKQGWATHPHNKTKQEMKTWLISASSFPRRSPGSKFMSLSTSVPASTGVPLTKLASHDNSSLLSSSSPSSQSSTSLPVPWHVVLAFPLSY